jgi:hypothetical protein
VKRPHALEETGLTRDRARRSGLVSGRAKALTTLCAASVAAVMTVVLVQWAASAGTAPRNTTKQKIWHPKKGVSWQWQLDGKIDTRVKAKVYDVDSSVSKGTVKGLHAKGRRVICYISAGSFEDWRPDARKFPASVKGATLDGYADERWLDIRQTKILGLIMAARMDVCRAKGFDGVEPDNVDGYANDTGFALTGAQQRTYNKKLASLAHARGLSVGLKNDIDQIKALQPYFDFAVNEQCVQYNECGAYGPFLRARKAVFHAEYTLRTAQFCPTSRSLGLSSIRKKLALGAWRQTC